MVTGSKKDKKNAKDGGVSAAVSKLAASRAANGNNPPKLPVSNPSSSGASPDIRPVGTPTSQDGHVNNVSPPLDALSATSISASTAASNNPDWMRGGFAGSPGNLISLMGESPPTLPSSYEDHPRIPFSRGNPQRAFRSPHTGASPSIAASPSPPSSVPSSFRRPTSYQPEAHFSHDMQQQQSHAAFRRASVQSPPFSHARGLSNPPLPHHPQAHFYGPPRLDYDLGSSSSMKAGDNGYFFGFDTLPSIQTESIPGSDNVVLAGYEGGLEVHSITKRGIERVAGLKGLRGGVLHAKILPWVYSASEERASHYPLVAVVVHGPTLPQSHNSNIHRGGHDATIDETLETPGSPPIEGSTKGSTAGQVPVAIEHYQTTVELYSLKTNQLVDVLLEAPKTALTMPITNPLFKAPPSTGAFSIKADAGYLGVASGTTGELWLYRPLEEPIGDGLPHFGCTGKLWTSLQQSLKGEGLEDVGQHPAPTPRANPQTPVFAVNGRWLAHCPPEASAQMALKAQVTVPIIGRGPGLASVAAPVLPVVTSVLDLPDPEGMMNKIMRETTQELISGAKWVGQQGLQAWNTYWNKNNAQQTARQPQSPPLSAQQWAGAFPPTHGTPGQAPSTKDPGLISIIDMATCGQSASIHPVTTFPSPLGCSFLSFSPTGLSLFAASNKGDVQTIWDLLCIQHTKPSALQTAMPPAIVGPRVRQVAHFSRMTVARIVDVAWTRPNGERIAIVTERGTVHLLDLPGAAFSWPPPRRRKVAETSGESVGEASTSSTAVSFASTALGAAFGAAKPLMGRTRTAGVNDPGANGGNSTKLVDSASQGGRAIAASISHSIGKTGTAISQMRQTAENRVSLPSSTRSPTSSCVMWLTGRRHHVPYVLGNGFVRSFPSKARRSRASSEKRQASRRAKDFTLPILPDTGLAPVIRHFIDTDEFPDMFDREMEGGNTLTLDIRARPAPVDLSAEASIPQAEIESSAPYQPFHTDRRVSLFEYGQGSASAPTTSAMDVLALHPPAPEISAVSDLLADTTLEDRPVSKKKKKQQQQQQQQQQQNPYQHEYGQQAPAPAQRLMPSAPDYTQPWAFGQEIGMVKLDLGHVPLVDEDFNSTSDDMRALPTSSMERVLHRGDNRDEIVVTTRRRRGGPRSATDEDGFFEDDCEVLDFADQRV